MEMNVGCLDRLARIFIGNVLLYLTLIQVIPCWGLIGALLIITGLSGYCLLYIPFKLNTTCCDQPKAH